MVTFYNPTKGNMKTFIEDSLDVTKEEEREIIEKLKNNKYARLLKYYAGFPTQTKLYYNK